MKRTLLLLISLFFVNLIQAQQRAVTETGEEVILFEDGTWKYQNEDQIYEKETPTNPNKFKKDKLTS